MQRNKRQDNIIDGIVLSILILNQSLSLIDLDTNVQSAAIQDGNISFF
jgi:hypothetical protein